MAQPKPMLTALSPADVEHAAQAAVNDARKALGEGWGWVSPAVRGAVVSDAVLSVACGWANGDSIPVSELRKVSVRAQALLRKLEQNPHR